ncbi:MAG: hypothetical protein ACE5JL_19230 [Dehalococcoidia bacterium]
MTVEEALAQLKTTLNKGLHPAAIPEVEKILTRLDLTPQNDTSYNLVKGGINGQERVYPVTCPQ